MGKELECSNKVSSSHISMISKWFHRFQLLLRAAPVARTILWFLISAEVAMSWNKTVQMIDYFVQRWLCRAEIRFSRNEVGFACTDINDQADLFRTFCHGATNPVQDATSPLYLPKSKAGVLFHLKCGRTLGGLSVEGIDEIFNGDFFNFMHVMFDIGMVYLRRTL